MQLAFTVSRVTLRLHSGRKRPATVHLTSGPIKKHSSEDCTSSYIRWGQHVHVGNLAFKTAKWAVLLFLTYEPILLEQNYEGNRKNADWIILLLWTGSIGWKFNRKEGYRDYTQGVCWRPLTGCLRACSPQKKFRWILSFITCVRLCGASIQRHVRRALAQIWSLRDD